MSKKCDQVPDFPADPPRSLQICQHRVNDEIAFQIAIDPSATTGQDGQPLDPISKAYVDNAPNPNLPLLRLMLGFLKPGGIMLDLGAHVGTFALTAAARGCRVLAVEASPRNGALLEESVRQNGWTQRFKVIHAAVTNRAGTIAFSAYGPWGHVAAAKVAMASVSVPAVPIDELLSREGCDRLDFIKMDVEGSEVAALEGGERFLRSKDAPPILYESNYLGLDYYDKTPRDLRAVFVKLGYGQHYLIRPGRLIPVTVEDLQGEIVGEYLAVKSPLPVLPGWRIDQPLSPRELIETIEANCLMDNRFRVQMGRALQEAPAGLRASRTLRAVLRSLKGDPCAEVRAAVQWYSEPRRPFLGRLWGAIRKRSAA